MRKMLKRAMALMSASVIVLSMLVGCGDSSSSSSSSGNQASATGDFTDYSAGFPENVTIKIPVYDRGFEGWNPTDNYYTKWVQKEFGDKYNVTVEYVSIGRSTEVQDYMQMVAAHTEPNIIMHYDMPQAVNYYSEGAIQDVNYEEIEYYAPTYYENLHSTIETYGKLDGNDAFIFAGRSPFYYDSMILIRKDWCDQVGMDIPTTNEEYDVLLEAWKEAGLGTKGDPLITKSFTYEYEWIDESISDEEKAIYLDLNIAPFTWKPTENYLRDMNAKYNAGLVDPEFYLNTEDSLTKGKFVSGQTGTYKFFISANTDVFDTLKANDPDAEVAVLGDTVAKGFNANYYEYPTYGMIMGISIDTTDEQRAAVYMYLDWLSQTENLEYLQHGIEGETYTVDADGIALPISAYNGEAKLSPNSNKDMWCLVEEVMTYGDEAKDLKAHESLLAPEGYGYLIQEQYEVCKEKEPYGIISPIFTKTVESSSDYSADLALLWQTAYVDCITCKPEEFDEKYAKHCEEYLDAGYQEILDEKQSLIDSGDVLFPS